VSLRSSPFFNGLLYGARGCDKLLLVSFVISYMAGWFGRFSSYCCHMNFSRVIPSTNLASRGLASATSFFVIYNNTGHDNQLAISTERLQNNMES